MVVLLLWWKLNDDLNLDILKDVAGKMNKETPGVTLTVGDDRRFLVSCTTFTDNCLGLLKALPVMLAYLN